MTSPETRSPSLTDPMEVGGKAASLAWLQSHGFRVPPWVVVPASWFQEFLADMDVEIPSGPDEAALAAVRDRILTRPWPEGMLQRLRECTAGLLDGAPLAARSSGTLEDLDDASFAGQYESFLELVGFDAVADAIRRCWASAFTERVFRYIEENRRDPQDLRMAVIVQRMVQAKCAGVAFSLDPIAGTDHEVLIEACPGLGEELVSGRIDPDRYRFDWRHGIEVEREARDPGRPVLGQERIAELAQVAAEVQAAYGRPVDLEWALDEDGLWLVQSRAVTGVGTRGFVGEWTTADFKDGGVSSSVCTPFMASLYERVFSSSLPEYLDAVGLTACEKEDQPWYMVAYARPYWNAGLVKRRLKRLPGFKERGFDEDLGIRPGYEGDGITTSFTPRSLVFGLRVLSRLSKSFARRLEVNPKLAETLTATMDAWDRRNRRDLSWEDYAEDCRRLLIEDYVGCESAYFRTIYDNSNAQTLFQEKLDALSRGKDAQALDSLSLMGGLHDLSHLRPTREEGELVAALRTSGDGAAFLEWGRERLLAAYHAEEDFPGRDAVLAYLDRWGWMAPHTLEILTPRWSEDPSPLFDSMARALSEEGEAGAADQAV